jgi:hypothetical protein
MSSNRFRRIKRLGAALTAGALGVGFLPIAALTGTASAAAPTPTAIDTSAFCANVPPDNPFTDLPASDVHFDNVLCMAFAEITLGTTPTTYSPSTPVRRDQMASFIARSIDKANELEDPAGPDAPLADLPAAGTSPDAFGDDTGDVHEDNINRLADAGIVQGLSDAQCVALGATPPCYGPAQSVTRAQMASFINRAIGFLTGTPLSSSTDFFDDDNGNVHEGNINGLASVGIVQGTGGGNYSPNDSVKRDTMGSFIMRYMAYLNSIGDIDILPPEAGGADISVTPSPIPEILFASTNAADPAGKRHFDVQVNTSTITGPVDVFLAPAGAPNIDPTTFEARWEDDNNDLRADQVNPTISNALQAKIVAINGVNPVGGATGYVDSQALPADGHFTVDIQLVGPINLAQGTPAVFLGVMRDANNDNRLSVDADKKATEPVGIGGLTAWTSPIPANVSSFTNTVIFGGFPFSLFNLLTTQTGPTDPANTQNTRFPYDDNDIFKINGVIVTKDQFNKALNAFDTILINFNNDPAGVSEFNITNDIGQAAPTDLTIQVLNTDSGATANDVRGTFTTPATNQSGVVYHVQRANTAGADGLCGTADDGLPSLSFADVTTVKLDTLIGQDPGDPLTFTIANNPDGCFAFRIQVINTATANTANGNQVGTAAAPILVPAPNDVTAPRIMTSAGKDIGNPGTVDTGDKVAALFDEQMNLANGDILRFKDFAGEFRNVVLGTGNTFTSTTRGGQTALVITFSAALTAEGDADGNAANNDGLLEFNGLTIDATTGVADLAGNEVALGTSDAAINLDTTAPNIASATGTVGFNQIIVIFDEAFDPTTAADPSKYKINNGGGITNDPVTNALPSTSTAPSTIAGTNGELIAKAWVQVTLNVQFPLQSGSTMTDAVADLLGNAGNITGTPVAITTNTGILASCAAPCEVTEAAGAGHTKTIAVSLATTPSSTVNLSVTSSNPGAGTVSPGTLTFTPANAMNPQNVTVTGVDNAGTGNTSFNIVFTPLAGSAPEYTALPPKNQAVTLVDDEVSGQPSMLLAGGDAIISVGTKTVTARYNEQVNCNGGNVTAAARYSYANSAATGVAGGPFPGSNIANGPDANSCVITFNSLPGNFTAGDAGTLSYTDGGGSGCGTNEVCDTDPVTTLEAATESAPASIAGSPDITSVVSSQFFNAIIVTYDEPIVCSTLDSTIPLTDEYTVTVNGGPVAITFEACSGGTQSNLVILQTNHTLTIPDLVVLTQSAGSTTDNRSNANTAQSPPPTVTI